MNQVQSYIKAEINKAYENLGISERWLRSPKNAQDADDAETEIRDTAFKAVQSIVAVIPVERFLGKVKDIVKSENPWVIHEWLLKAENRTNGGGVRLERILELVVESFDDEEVHEKASEIIFDYFLNFASNKQKSFIASDILEMFQEQHPEAELAF